MARKRDGGRRPAAEPAGEPSGSLADAISAHLELKQEHGADPDAVEQERQSALSPARREPDSAAVSHSAPESPPAIAEQVQPTAAPAAPAEDHDAVETALAPESLPAAESPSVEPPLEPVLPAEDTGNFEFDWDGEAEQPPAGEPVDTAELETPVPDVLEQTPEFFEETPEYDRLWFEERPPRDFDF